jgi:hypothetical protein
MACSVMKRLSMRMTASPIRRNGHLRWGMAGGSLADLNSGRCAGSRGPADGRGDTRQRHASSPAGCLSGTERPKSSPHQHSSSEMVVVRNALQFCKDSQVGNCLGAATIT